MTVSPTAMAPAYAVPVTTVPTPVSEKARSMARRKPPPEGGRTKVAAVLSGSNVDRDVFAKVLAG